MPPVLAPVSVIETAPKPVEKQEPVVEKPVQVLDDPVVEETRKMDSAGPIPECIEPLKDMTAELEDYIMLQCVFEHSDLITWELNGSELPPSTVVRQIGALSKIRIRSLTPQDIGKYTVTASNKFGTATTHCNLTPAISEEAEVTENTDTGYGTNSPTKKEGLLFRPKYANLFISREISNT
jgi:hypothetical protein